MSFGTNALRRTLVCASVSALLVTGAIGTAAAAAPSPSGAPAVARQQTTYNQPSYTSFYLGSDLDWSRVPVRRAS